MLSNSLDGRQNNQVKIKGTEDYQMPPPYREITLIKDDNTRDGGGERISFKFQQMVKMKLQQVKLFSNILIRTKSD